MLCALPSVLAAPLQAATPSASTTAKATVYQCEKCHMTYTAAQAKKYHYKDPMDGGKLVPISAHSAGVDARGDQGMGFSHEKTTHHFLLFKDGGAIAIVPDDPGDTANRDTIRHHLAMIAGMFQQGNFSLPMFIHDTTPPGIETMKRLKNEIAYQYEATKEGAQVSIRTSSPEALKAVHNFLRFQIKDHHTGDPLTVAGG